MIRRYLLQYLADRPGLFKPARDQLLAAVAVAVKHEWCEAGESAATAVGDAAGALLGSDVGDVRLLGLAFLNAVLTEFASNARSTATGMTIESHMRAKSSFEELVLPDVLRASTTSLRSAVAVIGAGPGGGGGGGGGGAAAAANEAQAAVELAESVLSWQFSSHRSRRLIGSLQTESSLYFRGGPMWQTVITPDLLDLIFGTYGMLRDVPEAAHALRQTMVQLCAVGGIFPHDGEAVGYLGVAVRGVVSVVNTFVLGDGRGDGVATADELLAFATMLSRLMGSFGFRAVVTSCGVGVAGELLGAAQTVLTESLRHMATGGADGDDGGHDGEGSASETVDAALETWVAVVQAEEFCANEEWMSGAALPFQAYLEARVSATVDALLNSISICLHDLMWLPCPKECSVR